MSVEWQTSVMEPILRIGDQRVFSNHGVALLSLLQHALGDVKP